MGDSRRWAYEKEMEERKAAYFPFSKDEWDKLEQPFKDKVAVGDLSSDERGSGARMNGNKLAVELIPVRVWREQLLSRVTVEGVDISSELELLFNVLESLAAFQEGKIVGRHLLTEVPIDWMKQAAKVLDYGRHKYAAWNWLKGMPWSVCFGCAIRHAIKIVEGVKIDEESGETHIGHFMCNVIMLATYDQTYLEGDDRPDSQYFGVL